MRSHGKPIVAGGCAALLLTLVIAVFWYQDWQYSLPTPRPQDLKQPVLGMVMSVAEVLPGTAKHDPSRPLLLHFFNPNCPCSRFNLDHIRELTRSYGERVNIVAVLEEDSPDRLKEGFRKTGLPIEAVVDSNRTLATALGVYSTPQAVILDARGALVFRGNYNSSRYCVDRRTEYARIALDAFLAGRPQPTLEPAAVIAYGCPLPKAHTETLLARGTP
ncbi:MAG TPA: redoxin domain-containing protein [Bryobacteraceae bacterium]|nr:redoxin domain-containing protein [Bryobacteraceae bacterium]